MQAPNLEGSIGPWKFNWKRQMEVFFEEHTPEINAETIINDLDALIQRKEGANGVDLEEYQKNLQKIQIITKQSTSASLLKDLP